MANAELLNSLETREEFYTRRHEEYMRDERPPCFSEASTIQWDRVGFAMSLDQTLERMVQDAAIVWEGGPGGAACRDRATLQCNQEPTWVPCQAEFTED